MHKVMRSLEDAGFVARSTPPEGGRTLEAVITRAGARVLAEVMPRIAEAEDRILAALDDDERRELVRLLTAVGATPPS
jgi:DNA-binding MarR family transcriptional regulator